MAFWRFFTDLGDAGVMAPAGAAIAAWFFYRGAWRDGARWLLLFCGGALLVAATKLAFLGWGIGWRSLDFTGISGHAMMATSVLTAAGFFVGAGFSVFGAWAGFATGASVGAVVAVSRVMVDAHSPSEALAGCVLGGVIAAGVIGAAEARPRAALAPLALAVTMFACVASGLTARAPTQDWLTKTALELSGRASPFSR